jgi:hypothetical protein
MPNFSSADPNAYLHLALQSAQGTPNSTVGKFRFIKYSAGNTFNVEANVVDMREGGDGLDFGYSYKQRLGVSGSLVFNARPETLGQLLAIIPGGATWDGASAPANHTFHSNHASFPYSTIAIGHPGTDLIHLFSDVRFTGLTLEGNAGEPLKVTAPWRGVFMGASHGLTPMIPSVMSEEPFLYHMGPSYLLDGTPDSTIESWSLGITLGTEDLQAQSVTLDDIVIQNRDYEFTITRRYQNATLWKKIAYGGGVAPTVSVATGAFRAVNQNNQAAALQRYLQIDLGLLSYRNDALAELNPDGVTVRETITAKPLKTASAAMTVLLRNQHASAYSA